MVRKGMKSEGMEWRGVGREERRGETGGNEEAKTGVRKLTDQESEWAGRARSARIIGVWEQRRRGRQDEREWGRKERRRMKGNEEDEIAAETLEERKD